MVEIISKQKQYYWTLVKKNGTRVWGGPCDEADVPAKAEAISESDFRRVKDDIPKPLESNIASLSNNIYESNELSKALKADPAGRNLAWGYVVRKKKDIAGERLAYSLVAYLTEEQLLRYYPDAEPIPFEKVRQVQLATKRKDDRSVIQILESNA